MKTTLCCTALLAALAAGVVVAQNAVTTDFSGEWTVVRSQDNTENPWVGDFFGLPLNAAITTLAWTQVSLILLVIIATVVVREWVSAKVRHAII